MTITQDELSAALVAVDPSVVMVRARIIRRAIKRTHSVRGGLGQVPHRKVFVISREDLLGCVARWELPVPREMKLPDRVVLMERPKADRLAETTREVSLVRAWRLLFHAHVHEAFEANSLLSQAAVRSRIDRIGQTAFDEIRAVLDGEGMLFDRRNDRDEFIEFAAVFLELSAFAPRLLERYFPGLADDQERLSRILAEDVDAAALLRNSRPLGAPDPGSLVQDAAQVPGDLRRESRGHPRRTGGRRWQHRLRQRADRRAGRGNLVRAAILRQRAGSGVGGATPESIDPDAAADVDRLVGRLKAALDFDGAAEAEFRELLGGLLPRATDGFRATEARLLYDLQKVCVDHEREIYTLDLVEWVRSLARRPVKRALPYQGEVLMCRHLRSAERRLVSVRMPEEDRTRLRRLVRSALVETEGRLRRRCRPELLRLVDTAGLQPSSPPEEVARDKLGEELLDRVAERGFLSLSDVRDAVSRNQLKLPDCRRPSDVWSASRLLRVDRELGVALDGVYRRGEVYLRWLQRISALGFGTRIGRAFARYLAIPFGGAFVVLEGLQHMVSPVLEMTIGAPLRLVDPWFLSVMALGVYFIGLLYVEGVRKRSLSVLHVVGKTLKHLFWLWPWRLVAHPAVRAFLATRMFRLGVRFLIKPLFLTALVMVPLMLFGVAGLTFLWTLASVFLASQLALNSPVGTAVEEVSTEWAWRTWHRFHGTFVVGLVRLLLHAFRAVLELVDRVLYAVDEWLRFRSGQGVVTLGVKALLGVVWFAVTWVVRVYVNLLLEPQVNPVKHFPVVTVSHKLMLPLIPSLISLGNGLLTAPLGPVIANAVTWTTVTLLPGLFGFLVWEFKENWRLYAANRSPRLSPVIVGSHGETVLRLMKPGFHSGTLPKAYARLRRAERKSLWTGEVVRARRQREVIHHIEHDVARWIERELIYLLSRSRGFQGQELRVLGVSAGSNAVHAEIGLGGSSDNSLVLALEEQSGWLVASVARPGWLSGLEDGERQAFRDGLCGLYKTAGVDFVRESIHDALGPDLPPHDISDEGLVVWPGPGYEVEEIRPLRPLNLERHPLTWQTWVGAWNADRAGKRGPALLPAVRLLPPRPR